MIAAMVWNSLDFHRVNTLPKVQTINASYDIEYSLLSILKLRLDSNGKCLVIHADNVKPYNVQKSQIFWKANSLRRVPHLPYSPDLAPSDFFLSGYMKHCLKRFFFCSAEKLLFEIHDILMGNHWLPYWLYLKTGWRDWSGWPHMKVITTSEIKFG
jgi:hypothetical protein